MYPSLNVCLSRGCAPDFDLAAIVALEAESITRIVFSLDANQTHFCAATRTKEQGLYRRRHFRRLHRGLARVVIFGLADCQQMALASFCKLLPGLGHLFKLLAMLRDGCPSHVPALGGVL